MTQHSLRADLRKVAEIVTPASRVLDIGCGEGALLGWLKEHKQVDGRGIDVSKKRVAAAIANGMAAVQGDADKDLPYYPEGIYDYVISCQTLQAMKEPKKVLGEMVRIGKQVIVSVPNFGNWKNRVYLGIKGRMPVTESLSYQWYETPNIHFCTINDFIALCEEMHIRIEKRYAVYGNDKTSAFLGHSARANLFGEMGVFLLSKK